MVDVFFSGSNCIEQLRVGQHDNPGGESERLGGQQHPAAVGQPARGLVWRVARLGQAARQQRGHLEHRMAQRHRSKPLGLLRPGLGRTGQGHSFQPKLVPARRPLGG